MSKRKVIEICKLLKTTISRMTTKVNIYKLDMYNNRIAKKKDLKMKLNFLKEKHNITDKDIDG